MGKREQLERQMDRLEAAYAAGEMEFGEYHAEMRELAHELREVEEAEEVLFGDC